LKSEGEFPQGIQELVVELISQEDFPQFLEKVSNYDKNTPEFKKFNAFLIQLKGEGAKKKRFDKLVNRYSKMSDYSVSEVEENLKKLINLGTIRPKETLKEEITELFLLITDDSQKSARILERLHKMFLELGKKLKKAGYPLEDNSKNWQRLPMETYKMWNYLYLTQNQAHIVVGGSAKDKDLEEFATEIGGTYKNSKIFPKNNSFTNMGGFVKQVNSSEKALKLYKKLRKNASFSWFKDGNTEKIDESSLKILQNVAEGGKYTVNTFNAELVKSYFGAINEVVSGDKKLFLPSKPQYVKSFYDYVVINDGNLNLNPIAKSMMEQNFSKEEWVSQINRIIRSGNVFSEYALKRNIIDDMYVKLSSQKDKADKDLTYRGIDLSSVDINQSEKELKRTLTNLFDGNRPKADTQSLEEFKAILNTKKQNSQNLEDNLSPTEGKLIENFLNQEAKDAKEQGLPNEFEDYSVVYFSAGQENVFDFPTGETDEAGQEIFEEKTVSEGADYAVLMVGQGDNKQEADKEELVDLIEETAKGEEKDKTNILSGLRELAEVKQTELGTKLKEIAEEETLANMLKNYNENATFPDISFKEVLSFLTLLGGTIGYDIEEVFDEIDKNPELAERKAEELNGIIPDLGEEFQKVLFTTLENHVKKLVDSDNTKAFGRFGFDKLSSVMLELEGSVLTKEG
jgi:hypothetical protein